MTESFPYGNNLKLYIDGGSHDAFITARLSGIPAGVVIDKDRIHAFMLRRSPGRDPLASSRCEDDLPHFLYGVRDGLTDGGEIVIRIYNNDARPGDYGYSDTPRPSHADYTAICRYGIHADISGGGHFSGRLTAALCAAGGVCLSYLAGLGITVVAHIFSVGDISDSPFDPVRVGGQERELLSHASFPVLDKAAGDSMRALIARVADDGDSVGGVIECAVCGMPVGAGEHMFAGCEGRISAALFGIPAVKGVEFGSGFSGSASRGSVNNDPFVTDGRSVMTLTNNAGGILGGMSDGMPIVFRAAVKPTPSIAREQSTVSLSRMENVKLLVGGRHDPCIVPRALPAVEAAAAVAVCDILLDRRQEEQGIDSLRSVIDRADRDIVPAFLRRMDAAREIGKIKKTSGAPVYAPLREKALLKRVSEASGENTADCVRLYERILSLSREKQRAVADLPPRVGFSQKQIYLIGMPLGHSISPLCHSLFADYKYGLKPMETDAIADFVSSRDFDAINVTVPYKRTVIHFLDALTPAAERIGAVNFIMKQPDGSLVGDNTDACGFSYMLDLSGIDVSGHTAIILGSGGASAAVRDTLVTRGAVPVTVSRTGESGHTYADLPVLLQRDGAILINATPVGMFPDTDDCPLDLCPHVADDLSHLSAVFDLVYNPVRTTLVCLAEDQGVPAYGGLPMLVAQAARACGAITGDEPGREEISRTIHRLYDELTNIVLIGMPGVGKSTVGACLASVTGRTFVDTDDEIYAATGVSPADLLVREGEDVFRRIEHEALLRSSRRRHAVIATGGGVVIRDDNRYPLRRTGVVVWLCRPIEELCTDGRPLSAGRSASALFAERESLYRRFADVVADVGNDPEINAAAVLDAVQNRCMRRTEPKAER